jgi:hypothetical protein
MDNIVTTTNYMRISHRRCFLYIQGEQIGRIFAFWAIDNFGQFFLICSSSQKYWATFFHGKS